MNAVCNVSQKKYESEAVYICIRRALREMSWWCVLLVMYYYIDRISHLRLHELLLPLLHCKYLNNAKAARTTRPNARNGHGLRD